MQRGCIRTLATASKDPEGAGDVAVASVPEDAASTPMISARSECIVSSSSRTELVLERQLPDALARRGKHRVRDRGRRDGRAGFADSAGRFEITDQMDLDVRRLVDSHHANVVKVGLLDPAVLERYATPESAADPEDDAAF